MKEIKAVLMDVDGTLTDGKIYLSDQGDEWKAFNVKDGLGIKKLIEVGIIPVIITGRQSKVVVKRAKELGIKYVYQNAGNKIAALDSFIKAENIEQFQILYVGDDDNDLEIMEKCGLCACPANASNSVKNKCDFISRMNGGDGAVREIIEWVFNN
ncbi:HAD hydrolase family protein [Clostridium sp. AM58-1XD]|uniref:KdsC family phosphatase n=1 Tax=Clostridium sp. AM58-1XD TaxID=2292307 RepID=UPI001FA8D22E|nr:HAD hydrolase family protein [Clostridium sp. AM58-1XD]